MKKFISGGFYPTQVVLIDDNSQTLMGIEMGLDPSLGGYKVFSDPRNGVSYINETSKLNQPHYLIKDAVDFLYREIYNPDRFNQISTVIVDYDMPGMNGLELCQQIECPHIQKILLTGAASEFLAVDAFNEGIINHFVRKQDPQAPNKLNHFVIEAQSRYFRSLSRGLVSTLTQDPFDTAISDPVFIEFFINFLKEKGIKEYYLFDPVGSFLLVDKDGNSSALYTYTSELLSLNHEMIKNEIQGQSGIDQGLIRDLIERKTKSFCFHYFENAQFPEISEWDYYMHPLFRLEGGRQEYYWSYAPHIKDIDRNKILSFEGFKSHFVI